MKKAHLMRGRRPLTRGLWIFGVMLVLFGLVSDKAIYERSMGTNVNLWWGLVLLVFGAAILWIFGVMLVVGSLASAVDTQPRQTQGDVVEHDFTDADQVEGDRNTPWGDRLGGRVRGERRSLIRPRWSFSRELRKSVENL